MLIRIKMLKLILNKKFKRKENDKWTIKTYK